MYPNLLFLSLRFLSHTLYIQDAGALMAPINIIKIVRPPSVILPISTNPTMHKQILSLNRRQLVIAIQEFPNSGISGLLYIPKFGNFATGIPEFHK